MKKGRDTSIRVSKSTKELVRRRKRIDESFNNVILRKFKTQKKRKRR